MTCNQIGSIGGVGNIRIGSHQGETCWIFLSCHPCCNSHHEWLILTFGIESNMFELLCIEVIFEYTIMFLIIGIVVLFLILELES